MILILGLTSLVVVNNILNHIIIKNVSKHVILKILLYLLGNVWEYFGDILDLLFCDIFWEYI